jgi:hypothetical protein
VLVCPSVSQRGMGLGAFRISNGDNRLASQERQIMDSLEISQVSVVDEQTWRCVMGLCGDEMNEGRVLLGACARASGPTEPVTR